MADDSLNQPVIVRAVSLNASSIPAGYSPAYTQYILSQSLDFTNVAGKANEAGKGAYDAQVKNDEQDDAIANLDTRVTANTAAIGLLEVRLTTAEGKIVVLRSDVDYLLDEVIDITASIVSLDGRVDTAESNISTIQTNYVSKAATSLQSIASPVGITTSLSVNGVKVLGPRQTGWTASTGTPYRGTFSSEGAMPVGATYSQSEVLAIANALRACLRRMVALEADLRTHGIID